MLIIKLITFRKKEKVKKGGGFILNDIVCNLHDAFNDIKDGDDDLIHNDNQVSYFGRRNLLKNLKETSSIY